MPNLFAFGVLRGRSQLEQIDFFFGWCCNVYCGATGVEGVVGQFRV